MCWSVNIFIGPLVDSFNLKIHVFQFWGKFCNYFIYKLPFFSFWNFSIWMLAYLIFLPLFFPLLFFTLWLFYSTSLESLSSSSFNPVSQYFISFISRILSCFLNVLFYNILFVLLYTNSSLFLRLFMIIFVSCSLSLLYLLVTYFSSFSLVPAFHIKAFFSLLIALIATWVEPTAQGLH